MPTPDLDPEIADRLRQRFRLYPEHVVPIPPRAYDRITQAIADFRAGHYPQDKLRWLQLSYCQKYCNFPHNPYRDTFIWTRQPREDMPRPKHRTLQPRVPMPGPHPAIKG